MDTLATNLLYFSLFNWIMVHAFKVMLWRGCGLWSTAKEGWHSELPGRMTDCDFSYVSVTVEEASGATT